MDILLWNNIGYSYPWYSNRLQPCHHSDVVSFIINTQRIRKEKANQHFGADRKSWRLKMNVRRQNVTISHEIIHQEGSTKWIMLNQKLLS